MSIIALDVGTTNTKAALLGANGNELAIESTPTPARTDQGRPIFAPDDIVAAVEKLIVVLARASLSEHDDPVTAMGVTSMSETGLLLDIADRSARTDFFAWFDLSAGSVLEEIGDATNQHDRFSLSGLQPSAKYGLAKILNLRRTSGLPISGSVWLSVADFVIFHLTGVTATCPSLAARTYAYSLKAGAWDLELVGKLGLSADLFPRIIPSLHPVGAVSADVTARLGLSGTVVVANAGHDHVCAAFAVCMDDETVLDSMGTAEALTGMIRARPLVQDDLESGLSFGPALLPGRMFWLGGIPSSGSSVAWATGVLSPSANDRPDTVPVDNAPHFLPYLTGSGAPRPDSRLRGAFLGLGLEHTANDLLAAVLEGTAHQAEWIRRTAEAVNGIDVREIVLSGGGSRNTSWVKTKASVFGVPVRVSAGIDDSLRGAALAALIAHRGIRDIPGVQDLRALWNSNKQTEVYQPTIADRDALRRRHVRFRELHEAAHRDLDTVCAIE